ncbi:hypothetical protein FOYG_11655 [Fusarium oxysporum NRRL 32931]|uniref:Uncharacterized protein n=1 Tax=Fusarium oxysporum NRRL 32931 TaxID=660029 RepID=W9I2I5_FUSOX|nr:hypothetical protein FOYG_11655 [Fusarium oxysporum NRRL 32931]
MIKEGDNSTFISYQRWAYGAPYSFNVYWKDGFELKNGKNEKDVTDLLEEGRDLSNVSSFGFEAWMRIKDTGTSKS